MAEGPEELLRWYDVDWICLNDCDVTLKAESA